MKKPVIAVDIDDVIADSTDSFRREANKRFGVELTKEHYQVEGDYWGYYERVWRSHGLGNQISHDDLGDEMVKDQSHVPLLAGASIALAELSGKFDIVLITSRDPKWEAATHKWLNEHFGDLFRGIYFAEKDSNKRTKGEICVNLGAFWLIDDNPEHCQSALDKGVKSILFGQYGWHHSAPANMVRCKDWPAVLEYFDDKR
jgi:5'(3')-deoxyribonucleotidase